eukprot:gene23062-34624_t
MTQHGAAGGAWGVSGRDERVAPRLMTVPTAPELPARGAEWAGAVVGCALGFAGIQSSRPGTPPGAALRDARRESRDLTPRSRDTGGHGDTEFAETMRVGAGAPRGRDAGAQRHHTPPGHGVGRPPTPEPRGGGAPWSSWRASRNAPRTHAMRVDHPRPLFRTQPVSGAGAP